MKLQQYQKPGTVTGIERAGIGFVTQHTSARFTIATDDDEVEIDLPYNALELGDPVWVTVTCKRRKKGRR